MFYLDSDKQEIRNWIQAAIATTEQKFNDKILKLQNDLDEQRNINAENQNLIDKQQKTISELLREIETLKSKNVPAPARQIHIDKPTGAYLSNNRAEILSKVKHAANVDNIIKFLDNNNDTAQKFRRLIDSHLKQVNKFIDKLNLDNIDDDELSETITAKYFKLFFNVFFDNILVAINRGDGAFYGEFLNVVNEYLGDCGIYTVDVKTGVKVTDEDYQNMTPQVKNTDDRNLNETIAEIERLPYRINYLDEFGEQKYLQYNGVMTIYKAV